MVIAAQQKWLTDENAHTIYRVYNNIRSTLNIAHKDAAQLNT